MELILETEGIEARAYTWEQLGFEVLGMVRTHITEVNRRNELS